MINENLFKSVETGDSNEVKKALSEEKINTTTYYGAKSINIATEKGNYEILKMLLESGAKIPRTSFWSNSYNIAFSCLSKATSNGRADMVKLMLEYGANAEKKDLRAAFNEALLSGNMEITKMLINAGVNVNLKVVNDITPLMFSVLFPIDEQELLVECLLAAGAYVNVKHETWITEGRKQKRVINTALTYAKERGYENIVEMLKNAKKYRK